MNNDDNVVSIKPVIGPLRQMSSAAWAREIYVSCLISKGMPHLAADRKASLAPDDIMDTLAETVFIATERLIELFENMSDEDRIALRNESHQERIISENEFSAALREVLVFPKEEEHPGWVTGPGRSGALAAVYASHILHIPYIPFGQFAHEKLGRVLLVDTARESGRTLRKALHKYETRNPIIRCVFEEPPRVSFWYESPKPQRYRHERQLKDK